MIVVVFIALVILAALEFNLRSIVSSATFVDNWNFLKSSIVSIWSNYLSGPIGYFWNTLFLPYIWNPIADNLSKSTGK